MIGVERLEPVMTVFGPFHREPAPAPGFSALAYLGLASAQMGMGWLWGDEEDDD